MRAQENAVWLLYQLGAVMGSWEFLCTYLFALRVCVCVCVCVRNSLLPAQTQSTMTTVLSLRRRVCPIKQSFNSPRSSFTSEHSDDSTANSSPKTPQNLKKWSVEGGHLK